jgi:ABC-type phosphate transport system substrate-binding protein
MFGLKLSRTRSDVRAALLAGATAAALVFGGVHASGAHAEAACNGVSVTGGGSSLQRLAHQSVWGPAFSATVCPGPEAPTVSYSSTDSGAGLAAWGADGSGSLDHGLQFVGTTQAPNAAEIQNIVAAARASDPAAEGSDLLVVPVAQTAIAIVANPPSGCSITQIKRQALEKAFEGRRKTWSDIGSATGKGCNQPITRVVPADVSGTTYQFKRYLSLVEAGELPCLTAGAGWSALQAKAVNTAWPEACKGHKALTAVKRSLLGGSGPAPGVGGVDEVQTVNSTPGSIGFAALPDAEAARVGTTTTLALENGTNAKGHATFAPAATAAKQANCGSTVYAVPAEAQLGGTTLDVDWSTTYGSALVSATYPICTLSWDLAFLSYGHAGFSAGQAVTVRDYLYEYMFEGAGQSDLAASGKGYSALPNPGDPSHDVFTAGVLAASAIGG